MDIAVTLVIQGVVFFVVAWLVMKLFWPGIMSAIETRQKKIAEGLAAASKSEKDLDEAEKRSKEIIREAAAEGNVVILGRRLKTARPGPAGMVTNGVAITRKSRCDRPRGPFHEKGPMVCDAGCDRTFAPTEWFACLARLAFKSQATYIRFVARAQMDRQLFLYEKAGFYLFG